MDDYRRELIEQIPRIAVEFFATFSRFEFALKRAGFLKGEIGRKAEPDWIEFSKALGLDFFGEMRAADKARILFDEQPKSLKVVDGNTVEFKTPSRIVNGQMMFEAVCLVRNNLFHGEKPYVTARDEALMNAALFVLDSAMNACGDIERCHAVPREFRFSRPIAES